jgi:arylsulfatase A-like enzyme
MRVLQAKYGTRLLNLRFVAYGLLLVLCLPLVSWLKSHAGAEGAVSQAPNVIIIGIDSLRTDFVGAGRRPGMTPNLDGFVRDGAHMFTDAITPLARTFPAMTSVLSGRYPRFTGARENLIPISSLNQFDTIARIAQGNGYRTIYSTDEVRFSNIDASYGFDQVITPTMGAADFLLGKFNDLPLSNLVVNSRLGRWMFPASHANRAATVTYLPESFVNRLDAEIEPAAPVLFVAHLALPHHPYVWAEPGDKVFARASDNSYQYTNAVIAADRQFGLIMELLERKGLLRNALVIVMSDHGEALGLPGTDTLLQGVVAREMLDGQRISLWGHGSSVLSPHQFSAFLAIRAFGAVDLPPVFRELAVPVSLVDVAPTIIDLAGMKSTARFDGMSLLPVMRGDADASDAFGRRPRFTESGFRTKKIEQGDFDERSVLGDVATYFRMDPATARFELRPDVMPYLLADKERAVLSANWLLAAIPSRSDPRFQKYVLVSRRGETPVRLEQAPPDDGSEVARLWSALHEHYGDELLPPGPREGLAGQAVAAQK